MKLYINLEHKSKIYRLFLLGYTSDGGFFVKDLINDGKEFLVMKALISNRIMQQFGEYSIDMKKCKFWSCVNSPKLTHHIDGTVHISGTGIMSGFYNFSSGTKGASTKSMDLRKRDNDGGPVFILYVADLPDIENNKKSAKSVLIRKRDQIIDPYFRSKKEDDKAFALEFFYLPKHTIQGLDLSTGTIDFIHPNYGTVPLKYIPAPDHAPGIIGVFTRVTGKNGDRRLFSFSLNGGTTKMLENGNYEQLIIAYPHDKEMTEGKRIDNLDFAGANKFKVEIDFIFYRIKTIFKKRER